MADARSAIERLLYDYAARVDAGDFAGVGALFDAATYRASVGPDIAEFSGADEVTDLLTGMVQLHEDGTPSTKHVITNAVIDVDDDAGTGRATSSFTVLQARPDLPLQVVAAGRYEDRFERVDGTWRFTDRLVRTELVGDLRAHLRTDPFAG